MSKKIEDYLPLYIGCCIEFTKDASYFIKKGFKEVLKENALVTLRDYELYDCIKLVLRPLSDMTDEERKEWMDFRLIDRIEPELALQLSEAARTKYLLSKHFDLFNLIPDLAIDVTIQDIAIKPQTKI